MEDEPALQTLVSNFTPRDCCRLFRTFSDQERKKKKEMMKNAWTRVFVAIYLLGLIGKSPSVFGEGCIFMRRCHPQCSSSKTKFRILIMDNDA